MSEPSYALRKARRADVPRLFELIAIATERGKILPRSRTDLRRSVRHFWVAEEGGRVIACCALEVYNRKLAEIRSLTVEPDRQNRGIASALIDQCLREARKRRVYEVLAITDRENLFKRKGFSDQLHGQTALFLRPSRPS